MELRCKKCSRKLGNNLVGKVEIVCPRCDAFNAFNSEVTYSQIVELDKQWQTVQHLKIEH